MAQNLTFNLGVDTNSAVQSINTFFQTFDAGAAKAKNSLNQAFGQTLQTEVEINLKNGELVAKKIQSAHQESKRLETAVKAMNGELGRTPNELKRQITILKQIQGNTEKYRQGTNKLTEDWKKVSGRIQEASNALKRMNSGSPLQQIKAGLTGIIGKFTLVQTLANVATGALMGMGRAVGEFGAMSGRMETLQLQLEGFTGSASAAAEAFRGFSDIAAQSPFNLEQVATAGKIMMAFGIDTETAMISTKQLGIAAAATGGDINLLARNLGQIAAQGQAYTRDLTQFAIQGIPIWEEMSAVTGKSVTELKKMASEGQISFEIVQQALNNLTREGTAFAEIAKRMQETFAGRMARIEASINELGLAFIQTFNKFDRALGKIVSGSMKLFADTIKFVAKNFETLTKCIVSATIALGVFVALNNIPAIIGAMAGLIMQWGVLTKGITAASVAQAVYAALSGQWANIAAAVAIGGLAYMGLSAAIDSVNQKEKQLLANSIAQSRATGELTERERKRFEELMLATDKELQKYDDLKEARDELKAQLDAEIAKLEQMKEKIKERYDEEIDDIQRVIDADRQRADEMREAQQAELDRVRERHDAALEAIDAEIGLLREKTGKEKELYQFQKQQLQQKIASGDLDKEEQLRAEARLSRMNRQEKIQDLMLQKKTLQKDQEKEIDGIQKRQKTNLDAILQGIKDQQQDIRDLKNKRDDETEVLQEVIDKNKGIGNEVDVSTEAVKAQITEVNRLGIEYGTAAGKVDDLAAKIRTAAIEQAKLNSLMAARAEGAATNQGTPLPTFFTGGPIKGGTKAQVNELGQEAFLSASGRLSMINAPAFGTWRAPSSGTVIPAHLTKQLNVPTGGVNLNSAAVSNASRAGAGGMSSMVRAIQGAMGGDTFNQSVTVQAANPVQAANNMMVEMTRLKRRRFG